MNARGERNTMKEGRTILMMTAACLCTPSESQEKGLESGGSRVVERFSDFFQNLDGDVRFLDEILYAGFQEF